MNQTSLKTPDNNENIINPQEGQTGAENSAVHKNVHSKRGAVAAAILAVGMALTPKSALAEKPTGNQHIAKVEQQPNKGQKTEEDKVSPRGKDTKQDKKHVAARVIEKPNPNRTKKPEDGNAVETSKPEDPKEQKDDKSKEKHPEPQHENGKEETHHPPGKITLSFVHEPAIESGEKHSESGTGAASVIAVPFAHISETTGAEFIFDGAILQKTDMVYQIGAGIGIDQHLPKGFAISAGVGLGLVHEEAKKSANKITEGVAWGEFATSYMPKDIGVTFTFTPHIPLEHFNLKNASFTVGAGLTLNLPSF